MISKNDNPCKDCVEPIRHIGCHGNCEKYLTWKKAYDEWNSKVFNERSKSRAVDKHLIDRSLKTKAEYRRKNR